MCTSQGFEMIVLLLAAPGGEYHASAAAETLGKVDAMRRYEFLRRKNVKDTDEETGILSN